uniref:Uncharacterized protein n=1 Tax=Leersia perrieri TaxID=77586 RepID=A0A0D9WXM2_9ORYZ
MMLPPASIFRFSCTIRVAVFIRLRLPYDMVQLLHLPQLKLLQFQRVSMSDSSLEIFLAGCPALEGLLLEDITGFHGLQINSSSIKSIGMRSISGKIAIVDAPSLEKFITLDGCKDLHVSVISAPRLEALGNFYDDGSFCTFEFGDTVIEVLDVDTLSTAVQSVKILAISSYSVKLYEIINLMRCFPCLGKFYVQWFRTGGNNVWCRKRRNFIKCFDIPLKTVVVANYHGVKSEINFAAFFLLNAKMLESLSLVINGGNYE